MKMFCDTIGARPTGSTKNKEAVDYAVEFLLNCLEICQYAPLK